MRPRKVVPHPRHRILGALNEFKDKEKVSFSEMPELEKWVLHRIFELSEHILLLNQELLDLQQIEEKLMTKIKFLSYETLNEDYVSELAQKTLGMIKEDNVLVILDE